MPSPKELLQEPKFKEQKKDRKQFNKIQNPIARERERERKKNKNKIKKQKTYLRDKSKS